MCTFGYRGFKSLPLRQFEKKLASLVNPPQRLAGKFIYSCCFEKVIVEPVTIWRVPGLKLEKLPENELDDSGWYFRSAIITEMEKDYKVVIDHPPGPCVFAWR